MKTRKIITLLFLATLFIPPSFACRFTIREIGYTPLQLQTYIMQLEVDTVARKDLFREFLVVADDHSATANIRYRITHKEGRREAVIALRNTRGITLASTTLTSPGEIESFYRKVLFSPLQRTLERQIGNVFAFLVCFCDPDDREVDSRVEKALEQFRKLAPTLDKSVREEIMKIVVPAAGRKNEEILLRAAGADPRGKDPVVMVLYGRGRLAGAPLEGEEITKDNILNQLVMLGTDCECGIDLSPLLKRAIPLQWTKKMGQATADMLGIDVGNPMVLTEMSKILSKEPTTTVDEALTFAPRTIDLDKALGKNKSKTVPEEDHPSKALNRTLWITGTFFLLLLLAGTILLFVKKR